MTSIINIIVFTTVTVLVIVIAYYCFYTYKINQKIQNEEITEKRMVDVSKVVMTTVIVLLIFYSIVLGIGLKQSRAQNSVINRNSYVSIDLNDYTYASYMGYKESDDASFAKLYSKDSNAGYTKDVQTDGDFVFTIFTRIGDGDNYHPDFLCFVDYVGEVTEGMCMYDEVAYHVTANGTRGGAMGTGGYGVKKSMLYMGNINVGQTLSITIGILNEQDEAEYRLADEKAYKEDEGEFPSFKDFSTSFGNVNIVIE